MRFITITVILNACLVAALPGFPFPRLPDGPNTPKLPEAPETINSPGQPGGEPGRWPPENQNPNSESPADPGRMPLPPPQQAKHPSCGGKKRMECMESDQFLPFQIQGREVLQRLDSVKVNPPQPPNAPSVEVMSAKYQNELTHKPFREVPWVLKGDKKDISAYDANNW